MELQDKDIKVIAELRQNARLPIRDIARKTGLRPSTVHQRMQRMAAEGVIEKFTIKLNNQAVGENFIVFILVKTSKDIENKVFSDARIKEVFGITGSFDLMLKCKFKDITEFNNFIIKLRKNEGITATETLVSTVVVKEEI